MAHSFLDQIQGISSNFHYRASDFKQLLFLNQTWMWAASQLDVLQKTAYLFRASNSGGGVFEQGSLLTSLLSLSHPVAWLKEDSMACEFKLQAMNSLLLK